MNRAPYLLQPAFCMMLAEGALEVMMQQSPVLDIALQSLQPGEYQDLVVAMAEQFAADYMAVLRTDAKPEFDA